ncbi:riboflavin synthase [Sulfoacidibacillus thermotolerans]|uniref:Riboflavin synthase n=1 Tax=Sulfoacidibacillus thermotolerans TaxID=1765684 RepID=A0A2U3D5Q0_SULT2|nr:riboflavin synthase [Sulfoacidibacillus thermotolerans]PWI56621.1 riboflavin synthase subunit alpha [Sulfoacidibacillus thermotolerans]
MFTGLIEEVGTLLKIERTGRALLLTVSAPTIFVDAKVGDSIAVNGVCLTVTKKEPGTIIVDAVPETVKRTALQFLTKGAKVNLERALQLGGRLDGHLVAGHVDGIGIVRSVERDEIAHVVTVSTEQNLLRYIVEKGSIAIDGVSLTVMSVASNSFQVSIIPHTATMTTLQDVQPGTKVNLEVDVIGKYVERLLGLSPQRQQPPSQMHTLTAKQLREWGY